MKFDTWDVRSLYRSRSLTATARELARNKLDLVGVQHLGKRGHGKNRGVYFFFGKGNESHQLGTGCFVHHKKYQQLIKWSLLVRGRWCNIIFLNVLAPSKEKSCD